MDANHIEAVGMIFRVPTFDYAKVSNAIDAGVLPEIDQQHMAAIFRNVVRCGSPLIEPGNPRAEIRRWMDRGVHLAQRRPCHPKHTNQQGGAHGE